MVIATDDDVWGWDQPQDRGSQPVRIAELPPIPRDRRCSPRRVAQSPDGRLLISTGGRGELWQLDGRATEFSQVLVPGFEIRCADALTVSEHGNLLAVSHSTRVSVLDLVNRRVLLEIPTQYVVRNVAFDRGATRLVMATGVKPDSPKDGPIASFEVWSIDARRRVLSKQLRGSTIRHTICTNAGGNLVATTIGSATNVWAVASDGQASLQSTFPGPPNVDYCSFTRDDQYLMIAGGWGLRRHFVDVERLADDVESRLLH